ncbi:Protein of unknown function DUF3468 [Penicillium alfredii]|uniref:Transcription factor domain-containing protein n=1 Tax=Penicillium alfredii TaxID=1506179 RepID=A0A9W9F9Z0_9EURO|nr:Protein of unknown function DUF3468 [Penicillium alfredii]KAJ5096372.1 Protein of unknown function DUF3468 [Penicillium alfredii]
MSSRKNQPAGHKKDGIHFVNARPASETEKLKTQRLVRAHVGKWISDQTRDRSTAPGSSSHSAKSEPSSYSLVSRPRQLPAIKHVLARDPRFHPSPSHASDSSDSSDDFAEPTELAAETPRHEFLPIEAPVSGVLDPFSTYPSHFPLELVHPCESHLLTVVWPGVAPLPEGETAGHSWFPLARSDPALFTAFMFASLCHQRVQWVNQWNPRTVFGPKQQSFLQLCEMEAIKLINKAVRDPVRVNSDAVLLSVICMAHHRTEEAGTHSHLRTPFNPPLQRLQWLDVYGCLRPNMIHIQGLVQMIIMRGGLKNIKTGSLPPTISLWVIPKTSHGLPKDLTDYVSYSSDIVTCSCFCVRPVFEFWPLDENHMGLSIQDILGFGPSDIDRGFGRLHYIGITPEMAEALQAALTYIKVVKSKLGTTYTVTTLADQRNITQHTLLSLPPASAIESTFTNPTHAATYEACRLATLIFSVSVIFPMPAQNNPLQRLAHQIQFVLCQPNAFALWSAPHTRVPLLWILMLGGIAAYGTPDRAWFGSALHDTTRRSGLSSWPIVKRALESMLWYGAACDEAAESLWIEAHRAYPVG